MWDFESLSPEEGYTTSRASLIERGSRYMWIYEKRFELKCKCTTKEQSTTIIQLGTYVRLHLDRVKEGHALKWPTYVNNLSAVWYYWDTTQYYWKLGVWSTGCFRIYIYVSLRGSRISRIAQTTTNSWISIPGWLRRMHIARKHLVAGTEKSQTRSRRTYAMLNWYEDKIRTTATRTFSALERIKTKHHGCKIGIGLEIFTAEFLIASGQSTTVSKQGRANKRSDFEVFRMLFLTLVNETLFSQW